MGLFIASLTDVPFAHLALGYFDIILLLFSMTIPSPKKIITISIVHKPPFPRTYELPHHIHSCDEVFLLTLINGVRNFFSAIEWTKPFSIHSSLFHLALMGNQYDNGGLATKDSMMTVGKPS